MWRTAAVQIRRKLAAFLCISLNLGHPLKNQLAKRLRLLFVMIELEYLPKVFPKVRIHRVDSRTRKALSPVYRYVHSKRHRQLSMLAWTSLLKALRWTEILHPFWRNWRRKNLICFRSRPWLQSRVVTPPCLMNRLARIQLVKRGLFAYVSFW